MLPEMASRIKSRKIFKRAVYVGLECLDSTYSPKASGEEGAGPRRLLMEAGGMQITFWWTILKTLPDAPEGNFPALVEGEVRPLREVSPRSASWKEDHRATWRLGIYCRDEDRENVAQAARRCLNIKKNRLIYRYINTF